MTFHVPPPGGPTRGMIRPPRRSIAPVLLVIAAFAAAVIACWPFLRSLVASAIGETRVYFIEGRVLDDSTGMGIPDAEVTVTSDWGFGFHLNPAVPESYRHVVTTDAIGAFRLKTRIAGSTMFTVKKTGYFTSSGTADPTVPVTIPMFASSDDPGRKRFQTGNLPQAGLSDPFRLDLEDGIMAADAPVYDVRVHWSASPDSVLAIAAAPGRQVQWRPLVLSTSRWFPGALGACEAPEDGYADSVAIPLSAGDAVCFVRRDDGPHYGAFTVRPRAWAAGPEQPEWRRPFGVVFNRDGGRGLCDERSIVMLR